MLVYLASPYTANTFHKKIQRFKEVCMDSADLMQLGFEVFCPIAHSHPIELEGMNEERDGDFWLKQDFAILKHCDVMVVDDLIPGWDESEGVFKETEFCIENEIPVAMLSEVFYASSFTDAFDGGPERIMSEAMSTSPTTF